MNDVNYKFVKTSDEHTADLLRKAGFQELAKEGKRWVFINEVGKLNFSDKDYNVSFDSKLIF